ncbi:MAG TPA: glycoside hydrolase family 3 N-terminal domain-containing protein [Anaerolineales bacterium]|nr:glycoside hydrolase family 3 N-terminal domain-containing protein [Anaerolineales bacterium]
MLPTATHLLPHQSPAQLLMTAFEGTQVPATFQKFLQEVPCGGVTLFRLLNDQSASGILELTQQLQSLAHSLNMPPLLIAVDQEGGQLNTLSAFTLFPSQMALGATHNPQLAFEMGFAIGTELAAVGVNVNYAPVCDVNSNPRNPNVGIRAFGDQPEWVGKLASQLIGGLQKSGVAATVKHFPGNGASTTDPHHALPIYPHTLQQLMAQDVEAFRLAFSAQPQLCMINHIAIPELTGNSGLPATISHKVISELLRKDLAFNGIVITDAMDMGAIRSGMGRVIDSVASIRAGTDLLLLSKDDGENRLIYESLVQAIERELLPTQRVAESLERISALKHWLAGYSRPAFEKVGCAEHRQLALTIARQSVTVTQNHSDWFPMPAEKWAGWLVLVPEGANQTLADTTAFEQHNPIHILRQHLPACQFLQYSQILPDEEFQHVLEQAQKAVGVLIGSNFANTSPTQANLVQAIAQVCPKTVHVALRTPYDLAVSPLPAVKICTYGQGEFALQALAEVLTGSIAAVGRLPVQLPAQL